MIEKVLLNELKLNPAGTVAEGAAVVGAAVAGAADVAGDDAEVDAVVDDELWLLLPHAAISPVSATALTLTSNRRDRR
jgi:hypothetical protein